jgi:hypothetical protein
MHWKLSALTAAATALLVVLSVSASAQAWAPAGEATIHPGVQVFTAGAQCTANFVFEEGSDVYLGQAAHCSGSGGTTETNGCTSGSLPLGTPVEISGASEPGTLAYNSWLTMQGRGETNEDTCAFNDLALIKVAAADLGRVNPSVPGWGGPTGVGSVEGLGSTVYSYGNSELRGGIGALSPKQGVLVQNEGGGWSHQVLTVTPGIPGDSGSGFLNASGEAIGVLSTVQLAPLAGSNGVGDIGREIAYMRANSSFAQMQLVPGTQAFNPNILEAARGSAPTTSTPPTPPPAAAKPPSNRSSPSASTRRALCRSRRRRAGARHAARGAGAHRRGRAGRRACRRRRGVVKPYDRRVR